MDAIRKPTTENDAVSAAASLPTLHLRTGVRAGSNYVPLGDAVAWFTHTTGLDKLAEKYTEITGHDCGCDERRDALNHLISY
jgi:hypothetical protein